MRGCEILREMRRGLVWFMLAIVLVGAQSAAAQVRLTDTLRVVGTSILPGDTGAVFIYTVNTEPLGGYTFRLRFDPTVLGIVTSAEDNSVAHTQLRGNFKTHWAAFIKPDVITFVAIFAEKQIGLDVGRGNTIEFRFFAHSGVPQGTTTQVVFEDAPHDTNASNWFAHWTGMYQYRPVRVPGFITIGEGAALAIACPFSVDLSCDESTNPEYTGVAIAGDPETMITYEDEVIAGSCSENFTIRRTWMASLAGHDTSCVQTITVRDTVPPTLSCPRTTNVEYGVSVDPANTGFPSTIDNCDLLPGTSYTDTEDWGTYPVHRIITRTWKATDACGNRDECRQIIRELAEGVPDTTTISDEPDPGAILSPNWPNPYWARPGCVDSLKYTIAHAGRVKLSIYDAAGRRMKTLVDGRADSAGIYKISWDGRDAEGNYVPSGIYVCRLELNGRAVMRNMAVMR